MTHIYVSKLTTIGSDNGLSPGRRQAIIWTNDGILLIRNFRTHFSEIVSEIHTFSFKKMHFKMSSGKWRSSCLGLNASKHFGHAFHRDCYCVCQNVFSPQSTPRIPPHYNDVIMGAIASQITSLTTVYSIVYSDADQRKHQSSASLAFVRGIHRGPVNSPHKWPVTGKMFPFDDVIIRKQKWHINDRLDKFSLLLLIIYLTYFLNYLNNIP